MAGQGSGIVFDAMMIDLGNNRLEDLARDVNPRGGQNTHATAEPPATQPREVANKKANAWNHAVASGAFRDDDSRGVDGLDTIANGRLHAHNAQLRARPDVPRNAGPRSQYNPLNPSAAIHGPRRRFSPQRQNHDSYGIAENNIAFSPQAEGGPTPIRPTRPVPAFSGAAGLDAAVPQRGAVQSIPRHPLSSHSRSAVPSSSTPTRTADASRDAVSSPADGAILPHLRAATTSLQRPSNDPASSLRRGAINGNAKPSASAQSPAGGIAASLTTSSQRAASPVSASVSTRTWPVQTAQGLPPHLCPSSPVVVSKALASSLPMANITLQSSKDMAPVPAAPRSDEPSTQGGSSIRPTPDVTVFFESAIQSPRAAGTKDGNLFLYKHPQKNVCIWEMRLEDGYMVRDDARAIVNPIFKLGSALLLRRQDASDEPIRATNVRLGSMTQADEFVKLLKDLMLMFAYSSDPRYPAEEIEDTKQSAMIDISTLSPLEDAMDAESIVEDPNSPQATVKSFASAQSISEDQDSNKDQETASVKQEPTDNEDVLRLEDDVLANMIQQLDRNQADGRSKSYADIDYMVKKTEETLDTETPHLPSDANKKHVNVEPLVPSTESEVLIDTTLASPEPTRRSCARDLEGIVYHPTHASTSALDPEIVVNHGTNNSGQISSSSASSKALANSIKVESPEPSVQPEPSKDNEVSEPSLALRESPASGRQQVMQCDANKKGAINASKLKSIPVGIGLSHASMTVLSSLTAYNYRIMSRTFDDMVEWIERTQMYREGSVKEFSAVQTLVMHLARHTTFRSLNHEDQLQTAAVVFANLRQLKRQSRIVYSPLQILELETHARRAPPAVLLLNEFIDLSRLVCRTTSHLSPVRSSIAHSRGTVSARQTQSGLSNDEPTHGSSRQTSPRPSSPLRHSRLGLAPANDGHLHVPSERAEMPDQGECSTTQAVSAVTSAPAAESSPPTVQTNDYTPSTGDQVRELPPHLRAMGRSHANGGLGGSRWA
ncbi:hypothetical protein JX265_006832 [Neoarthrinium moseri]|uniref:Uncharacterized protein n=1 Tax=Neoarthrinium moseri TaxID=1658444 RepID=A0A9Q0AP44_9PEZI|nr:hypothetical protein JX265_006832 [Neoarthrinium moseri]